nr:hypothetical protein [Halarchaeum acidiphilum]
MAPDLRSNWRVIVLAILLIGSLGALLVPGAAPVVGGSATGNASTTGGGPTNLQYGLQLSGGTRVRAPVVGVTAENASLPSNGSQQETITQSIAANLATSPRATSACARRVTATPSRCSRTSRTRSSATRSARPDSTRARSPSVTASPPPRGATSSTRSPIR